MFLMSNLIPLCQRIYSVRFQSFKIMESCPVGYHMSFDCFTYVWKECAFYGCCVYSSINIIRLRVTDNISQMFYFLTNLFFIKRSTSSEARVPKSPRDWISLALLVVLSAFGVWLWNPVIRFTHILNCSVFFIFGLSSWESLGLQGDPTSPSWRRSVLGVHWKDWCWSWNSNTLATSCEELTRWKRPWCWEGLGAGGEGDDRGWDGWMASPTQWAWVNSGSWW